MPAARACTLLLKMSDPSRTGQPEPTVIVSGGSRPATLRTLPAQVWTVTAIERGHVVMSSDDGDTVRLVR